jgi:PAS domain S-box-containing protein
VKRRSRPTSDLEGRTSERAVALFRAHQDTIFRRTDRLFAGLMLAQWVAGVAAACWITPRTWVGTTSTIHLHVWAAVLLGGVITSLPVALALLRPGETSTRHVIAFSQALTSALLIHVTGGRIETHFHVFGSLAFLAFYRDWRVLVTASVVVATDHLVRGVVWPQSVYGVVAASSWRWVEHSAWVVFGDVFLVTSCLQGVREMRHIAERQAILEATNERIEQEVLERTTQLRESEARFRSLSASSPLGIFQSDADGRFTYTNPRWQAITGLTSEQSRGNGWVVALHPEDRESCLARWASVVRDKRAASFEYRIRATDGTVRWVHAHTGPLVGEDGAVMGHVGILEDVTEQRTLETELRQAQKLESMGRLTAGIAREISTPVQYVSDNARFLQDAVRQLLDLLGGYGDLRKAAAGAVAPETLRTVQELEDALDGPYLRQEIPKAIAETLDGVEAVTAIVRAMKEFAHLERKGKVETDINQALRHTITVARNELATVAEIETDLGELPLVSCYPGDVNQVFLHLLVNAADAVGEVIRESRKRGTIRVRTAREGHQVVVAISDTGSGIAEDIQARIFDPFFTTKPAGRGTGQGLAIARNVVVGKHKGSLTFETRPGEGTTFFVRLPIRDIGEQPVEVAPGATVTAA